MPTEGRALTGVAVSATLHCLTGCAIGEVTGMAIGTALGFTDLQTIALAVGLAFLFGYALTSLPLLRAGLALGAVIPIALASDTLSIAVMEVTDNAIMLLVPGAMEAGLADVLFWGALSFALAIAFLFALPANRWLISKGKGHTAVHNTGIHGGPPPRVVGAVLAIAAVFGTTVLVAEAVSKEGEGHGGHASAGPVDHTNHSEEGAMPTSAESETVRGVTVAENGLTLELPKTQLPQEKESELSFQIIGGDGRPVTDFEVEHEKQMHLIVVRRDLTGFQHLHPQMREDGTWSTPITFTDAGSYRVFADFNHGGRSFTLGSDLSIDGRADYRDLPTQETKTVTASGYEVKIEGAPAEAGQGRELAFTVSRAGKAVEVEQYLGAGGHLVALREGDLAFLHVHPAGHQGHGEKAAHDAAIRFMTEFPTEGRYRLFLQFKHEGVVHTAEFTREVTR
jgi:hypothetical protein